MAGLAAMTRRDYSLHVSILIGALAALLMWCAGTYVLARWGVL